MIRLENGFSYDVFLEEAGDNRYKVVFGSYQPQIKKGWDGLDLKTITFMEIDGTPRFIVGENVDSIEEKEIEVSDEESKVENFVTFGARGIPKDLIREDKDYG